MTPIRPPRRPRVAAALATAAVALAATACGLPDALNPASNRGGDIRVLYTTSFVIGALLFLAVVGILGWVLVHFRAGIRDAASQVSGNRRLEITWTLATLGVVATLFVLSARTIRSVDATSGPTAMQIDVVGHQWWWEFRYPAAGVVTADELHVPVNTPITFRVTSADVVHSFWVPRFGWKEDAIPGKANVISLTLNHTGTFQGECSEFCGVEHAWMRFRVVAQSPQAFHAWLQAQQQPAAAPQPGGLPAQGAALFQRLACASCHTIAGTAAHGTVGPNLTHLGSRSIIAGGVLDNTRANLARWLANPQAVKPGVRMPSLGLSKTQVDALTAYLEGLQ